MSDNKQIQKSVINIAHKYTSSRIAPIKSEKEFFSFITHAVAAVCTFIGMLGFLILNEIPSNYIPILIYGLSSTFLFTSSSVYHATSEKDNIVTFWRKLDHIAIYVMIAGSITPICMVYLKGFLLWSIIIVQWGCVLFGIWYKVFHFDGSKKINITIYLTQGWIAVIPVSAIINQVNPLIPVLMAIGGILYSVGAFIYERDKPNLLPNYFEAHELFHIFTILAVLFHFFAFKLIFSI